MPEISQERLGQTLRRLRVGRGWTQSQFAEEVFQETGEHAFKSVSRIEKGLQPLSADQLEKVERAFNISLVALAEQEGDAANPRLLRLLTNTEYFREHAEFIDRAVAAAKDMPASRRPTAPVDTFFFHPTEYLPVLRRSDVKRRWVENLLEGINKHLVWPLIFAEERTIRIYVLLAAELLTDLGERARLKNNGPCGRIYFRALDLGQASESLREYYAQVTEENASLTSIGLHFEPIIDVLKNQSQRDTLAWRSVILNKSNVPGIASYSATYVNQVCASPGDELISGWEYYGPQMHVRLEEAADDLLDSRGNKTKKAASKR